MAAVGSVTGPAGCARDLPALSLAIVFSLASFGQAQPNHAPASTASESPEAIDQLNQLPTTGIPPGEDPFVAPEVIESDDAEITLSPDLHLSASWPGRGLSAALLALGGLVLLVASFLYVRWRLQA